MRFGRKKKKYTSDHDRGVIMNFVKKWESFDWTVSLDNNN